MMEIATWATRPEDLEDLGDASRIYLGHETCERLLPDEDAARALGALAFARRVAVTLVTPGLSDRGIVRARRLVDGLREVLDTVEVACSDWGLLCALAREGTTTLALGRHLSGQLTDPRLLRLVSPVTISGGGAKEVQHVDGTRCQLRRAEARPSLASRVRGSALDDPAVRSFLLQNGVRRVELSHLPQGTSLPPGFSCSLHVSDLPLAVFDRCPGVSEDLVSPRACAPPRCGSEEVRWLGLEVPGRVYRRANALWYRPSESLGEAFPTGVDRLVLREDRSGS